MTPEGRMDPLRQARAKLEEAYDLMDGADPEARRLVCNAVQDLCEALLVTPVPPPSADARAKLEQARQLYWNIKRHLEIAATLNVGRARPTQADAVAEANILALLVSALPPHEGETPQPLEPRSVRYECGCEYHGHLASASCPTHPAYPALEPLPEALADAWYAGRRSIQDIPAETATGPQLQTACRAVVRALAHRATLEGETPQPAAVSVWRAQAARDLYDIIRDYQRSAAILGDRPVAQAVAEANILAAIEHFL